MMKKENTGKAIEMYNQVCEGYCMQNRISAAARLKKKIAEIYEDDYAFDLAAKYYQESVDMYEMEGDSTIAS